VPGGPRANPRARFCPSPITSARHVSVGPRFLRKPLQTPRRLVRVQADIRPPMQYHRSRANLPMPRTRATRSILPHRWVRRCGPGPSWIFERHVVENARADHKNSPTIPARYGRRRHELSVLHHVRLSHVRSGRGASPCCHATMASPSPSRNHEWPPPRRRSPRRPEAPQGARSNG